jgi:hypothetical protein
VAWVQHHAAQVAFLTLMCRQDSLLLLATFMRAAAAAASAGASLQLRRLQLSGTTTSHSSAVRFIASLLPLLPAVEHVGFEAQLVDLCADAAVTSDEEDTVDILDGTASRDLRDRQLQGDPVIACLQLHTVTGADGLAACLTLPGAKRHPVLDKLSAAGSRAL